MRNKKWVRRLLAYVTGSVNQELLLQNAAENRILRAKLPSRLPASRQPDTILARYRISSRSSRAPNVGGITATLLLLRKWLHWWREWRERTPAGDMTPSSGP